MSLAGPLRAAAAFAAFACAMMLHAQSAEPLAFEVASIKPSILPAGVFLAAKPYEPTVPFRISGNRIIARASTVTDLILKAYNVKEFQITGESRKLFPAVGDRYDIEARAPGDATPAVEQVRLMFQSLLAERFKLKLHREMKQLPVYQVVIGKGGSKLTPAPLDDSKAHSVDELVDAISLDVDRPIIDKTGLAGKFEYTLDWTQLGQARREDPDGYASGALSRALERLGLKLEATKDQVEMLIIDHVERPSAN